MFRSQVTVRVASLAFLAQVACSSSNGTEADSNPDGGEPAPSASSSSSGGGSHPAATDAGGTVTQDGAPVMTGDAGPTHLTADGAAPAADGSTTSQVNPDAATSDAGTSISDASTGPDVAPVPGAAVLSSFTANQSGRGGTDLLLTLSGTDYSQSSFGVDISLQDSSGKPVLGFTDWKGVKSGERVVLFDNANTAGASAFTRTVTLRGFARAYPTIAKVVASVANNLGSSNSVTVSVTPIGWPTAGHACDPAVVTSTCTLGLGCAGTPPVCVQGVAPQISKLAYIQSSSGPRILPTGPAIAVDLSMIHIAFLDQAGHSVLADMTGNGDYQSYYDANAAGLSNLGAFFDAIQAAPHFDSTVAQIVATPIGASTGSGTPVSATIKALALGATGASCDIRGYSGCVAGDSCIPGATPGQAVCKATTAAQTAAAQVAGVLDPATPSLLATGYTSPIPLWGNPPLHCLPPEALGFPQGIALLHLSEDAASLTLTAGNPETNFPNAIFVLSGTGSSITGPALGCNGGSPSTLTLSNVAAGDYTVVINSRNTIGGQFGLSVK